MGTKQLNAMSPRNFKQKIELLKKKEAASTANFIAAIRDARELCQIAGVNVPSDVGLDRTSLLKANSVPDINIPATCRISPGFSQAQCTTELLPISVCPPGTSSFSPIPNSSPSIRAAAAAASSCSHLSSVPLSTSVGPAMGMSFFRFPEEPRSAEFPPPYSTIPDDVISTGYPNKPISLSNQESRWLSQDSCIHNPTAITCVATHPPIESSFSRPKVEVGIPGSLETQQSYDTTTGHTLSYTGLTPSGAFSTSNLCHRSATDRPVLPPHRHHHHRQHPHLHNQTLQRAVSSYQHPLSTFVENVGPSPVMCTDVRSSIVQQPVHMLQQQQQQQRQQEEQHQSQVPLLSTTMGQIDWRRVSSDSSIRNTMAASHTKPPIPPTHHQPTTGGSNHKLPCPISTYVPRSELLHPTGYSCSVIHSKKPDSISLRRHFPVEMMPTTVAKTSPHLPLDRIDPSGQSVSYATDVDGHLLPAKRPFTAASNPTMSPHPSTISDHYYSGLHNLTLEDPAPCPTDPNDEFVPHNRVPFESPYPSSSAKPVTIIQPTAPLHPPPRPPGPYQVHVRKLPTPSTPTSSVTHIEASSTIPSICLPPQLSAVQDSKQDSMDFGDGLFDLAAADSIDLDRYLQVPISLLDASDASDWGGRRDSCTMTAEVLSALSTYRSATPSQMENQLPMPDGTKQSPFDQLIYSADSLGLMGDTMDEDENPPRTTGRRPSVKTPVMQDVADKLGISISSNDYQLLTDPELVDYVTDANTEAQLLL